MYFVTHLYNSCFKLQHHCRFSFTLQSFADLYASHYGGFPAEKLAQRLWGDIYFSREKRTFSKTPGTGGADRTFVEFVLEPLYKLIAQVKFCVEPLYKLIAQVKYCVKPLYKLIAQVKYCVEPLYKLIAQVKYCVEPLYKLIAQVKYCVEPLYKLIAQVKYCIGTPLQTYCTG